MTAAGDILLLAADEVAAELADLTAEQRFVHRRDGYEAITEFASKPYEAVVVSHPWPDFTGLVRGFRRLRSSAKCYALCSPAGEAELRVSGAEALDDYFIYPPRPEELRLILGEEAAGAQPAEGAAELSAAEMAELVGAAGTLDSLAQHVARRVKEWTGRDVHWAAVGDPEAPGWPLLLLDDDPPRVLMAEDSPPLAEAVRAKLASLQALLAPLTVNTRRSDKLHQLAITDYLTGAYNRRYFYRFTDQVLARAEKEDFRVTLLLYDIDDFKRYNDTYGHAVGDDILRETARLMTGATREQDIVARIGGDEFAVLFWDSEPPRQADSHHPESAQDIAGRFLSLLASHEFRSLGPEAKGELTISGGLATFPGDGQSCRALLRRADMAMRAAKTGGKSGIYIVGAGGDEPKPIPHPKPAAKKPAPRKNRPKPPQK